MKLLAFLILTSLSISSIAQDTSLVNVDTSLKGVTVYAYGAQRTLAETPASVVTLTSLQKDRFSNISLVPALNTLSGVRLEERSPGSYRINIRGSSLRAPFGVRNVRVYYNEIPLTDPTGFTYFNQLGYLQASTIDIIKGPGSSLYGAGNGGVLLINTVDNSSEKVAVAYTAGSFGLHSINASVNFNTGSRQHAIQYQHASSNGFREQSATKRNVFSARTDLVNEKRTSLTAHFLFNDLHYQTPGALTLTEFTANPRQARPRVGNIPGAVENNASIDQTNFLAGLVLNQKITNQIKNTTSLYGTWSEINNPTIRNYSISHEPHWGGRSVFSYLTELKAIKLRLLAGVEIQQQNVKSSVYTNKMGNRDSLLNSTNAQIFQNTEFIQGTLKYRRLTLETGLSLNSTKVALKTIGSDYQSQLEASPRVAILYRIGEMLSPYLNVSRGFSPPTISELTPTGSSVNLGLLPEKGWNYELGFRKSDVANRFHFDVNAFYYQLSNAIVLRRDNSGGDNYINAGRTQQIGIDASTDYLVFRDTIKNSKIVIWATGDYYAFHYLDFVQVDKDYSGSTMPGTPNCALNAGIDVKMNRLKFFCTYNYTGHMALNDANDASVSPFHLIGMKSEYDISHKKVAVTVSIGAENILNKSYSLGYDINAAGGRYYNSAGGMSLYFGITCKLK